MAGDAPRRVIPVALLKDHSGEVPVGKHLSYYASVRPQRTMQHLEEKHGLDAGAERSRWMFDGALMDQMHREAHERGTTASVVAHFEEVTAMQVFAALENPHTHGQDKMWLHGTRTEFSPGDLIGFPHGHVWATLDPVVAHEDYAHGARGSGRPRVYEVEPTGPSLYGPDDDQYKSREPMRVVREHLYQCNRWECRESTREAALFSHFGVDEPVGLPDGSPGGQVGIAPGEVVKHAGLVPGAEEFRSLAVPGDLPHQVGGDQGVELDAPGRGDGHTAVRALGSVVEAPGEGDFGSVQDGANLVHQRQVTAVDDHLQDGSPFRGPGEGDGSLSVDDSGEPGEIGVSRQASLRYDGGKDAYHSTPRAAVLTNPHTGGTDWFHGSPFSFGQFSGDQPDSRLEYEPDDEDSSHWNALLGHHFTASHEMAEDFSRGEHSPAPHGDYGGEPAQNIVHARLELRNPRVYASEHDIDQEAYEHEHRAGNHHDAYHHPDLADGQEDWRFEDRPATYQYAGHGDRLRGKDEQDPVYWHQNRQFHPYATGWLNSHPDKYGIAQRHRQRLEAQGHDGIVYGNEFEKHHGTADQHHVCAIPFRADQIDVTQRHSGPDCLPAHEAERQWPGRSQPMLPGVGAYEAAFDVTAHLGANDDAEDFDHPEYGNFDDQEGLYHHPDRGWHCHACDGYHEDAETVSRHDTGHTNWDRVYPGLPGEMHRGIRIDDDGSYGRNYMHLHRDDTAGSESTARAVMGYLGDLGTHWTPSEEQARHYAGIGGYHRAAGDTMHVIVHARKPEREHIETDPDTLAGQNVIGFDGHDDAEIPLKAGAPVHVNGVSWKFHDEPDSAWRRHDFTERAEHTAAAGPPPEEHEDNWTPEHGPHPDAECPECGHSVRESQGEQLSLNIGLGQPVPSLLVRCGNCGNVFSARKSGTQARHDREAAEMNHADYERNRIAGEKLFGHFTDSYTHPMIGWDGARDLVSQWHRDEHQFTGPGGIQMQQGTPMARQVREHRFNRVLHDPAASRPVELRRPGGDITRMSAAVPPAPSFTWRYQTYGKGPEGGYVDEQQTVTGPFYHGSRSRRMRPGGMLRPGMPTNSWGDEGARSQFIHFTTDLGGARTYAREAGGHVYEIEPTGEVHMGYGGGEWKSRHPLRVIRRVPDEEEPMEPRTAALPDVVAHFGPPGHFEYYHGEGSEDGRPRTRELEEHLYANGHGRSRWDTTVDDAIPRAQSAAYEGEGTNSQKYARYHERLEHLHTFEHEDAMARAHQHVEAGGDPGYMAEHRQELESGHHQQWQDEWEGRAQHQREVAEHLENGQVHMHGRDVPFHEMTSHLQTEHGVPSHGLPEHQLPESSHHDPYAQSLEEMHDEAHGDMGEYRHTDHGEYATMHGRALGSWDAEHHLAEHHGFDIDELRQNEPSFDEMEQQHEHDHRENRRHLSHGPFDRMDADFHLPGHWNYREPYEMEEEDPAHHFDVHSTDEEGQHRTQTYHALDEDHARELHEDENPDHYITGVTPTPYRRPARIDTEADAPSEHGPDSDTASTWSHVPYAEPPRSREALEAHVREVHRSSPAGYGGSLSSLHNHMHDSGQADHQHDLPGGHDPVFGSARALTAHFENDDEEEPHEEESWRRVRPETDEHGYEWPMREEWNSGIRERIPDEPPRCDTCSGHYFQRTYHWPEDGHGEEVDRAQERRTAEDILADDEVPAHPDQFSYRAHHSYVEPPSEEGVRQHLHNWHDISRTFMEPLSDRGLLGSHRIVHEESPGHGGHQHDDPEGGGHDPVFGSVTATRNHWDMTEAGMRLHLRDEHGIADPGEDPAAVHWGQHSGDTQRHVHPDLEREFVQAANPSISRGDAFIMNYGKDGGLIDPVFGSAQGHALEAHFGALAPVIEAAHSLGRWEPQSAAEAAEMARDAPRLLAALRDGILRVARRLEDAPVHPDVPEALHDMTRALATAAADAERSVRGLPTEGSWQDPGSSPN